MQMIGALPHDDDVALMTNVDYTLDAWQGHYLVAEVFSLCTNSIKSPSFTTPR